MRVLLRPPRVPLVLARHRLKHLGAGREGGRWESGGEGRMASGVEW